MRQKLWKKMVVGALTAATVLALTGCENPLSSVFGGEEEKVESIIGDRSAVGEYVWKQGKVELGDTHEDIGTVKIDSKNKIWLNRENLCKSVNKSDNTIYECRNTSYQIIVTKDKITIARYDEEEHEFPTDDNRKAVFTK
ncbi:MAG: hypothetical protein K6G63_09925 [Eubacterium sp.]|nr:hypothetical protein [Eubacterium sp.]